MCRHGAFPLEGVGSLPSGDSACLQRRGDREGRKTPGSGHVLRLRAANSIFTFFFSLGCWVGFFFFAFFFFPETVALRNE